ncbi:unnamed protein product, partial [Timema podura]|nr:unnamed protein product [Timema podura]
MESKLNHFYSRYMMNSSLHLPQEGEDMVATATVASVINIPTSNNMQSTTRNTKQNESLELQPSLRKPELNYLTEPYPNVELTSSSSSLKDSVKSSFPENKNSNLPFTIYVDTEENNAGSSGIVPINSLKEETGDSSSSKMPSLKSNHAQQFGLPSVDIAASSSNSSLTRVQQSELHTNENMLSVVPFKLEKEDSKRKYTPEGSLDVFDKENRVCGFIDQSSIHSQSFTVNTQEAMNAVRDLWTTPKDYWLPNDARPDFRVQTNSPATHNPRHKLFAIEQPAPAQVLNPVTFPIFSDESSACEPQHSARSSVIPGSILKPSVLSHKVDMPKRRTVAANSAVLDKENVPFPIYCDDEEGEENDDEAEFGKDRHLQQPKTLGELPFVPSPGMTAEEELSLMGTEDKENQSRGKALMQPPKRRLAGILQPAIDIPLNQQPEESVAMVFSEVSNETCNTQAFSFPLKSSTPFTTDLNKSFPVDTSMIDPDNGTISLALQPAIPSRPEEKTLEKSGPLQPSTGSDNLSVIMENSREFYKSSSSSGSSAVSSTRRTTFFNSQYPGANSLDKVQETSSCSETGHMLTRRKQRQVENVVSHTSIKDTDIQGKRKVPENPLATNQEEELMKGVGNLVMDFSQLDPFDEVLKERLLTSVGFPQNREQSFFILEATLPRLKISSNITLG